MNNQVNQHSEDSNQKLVLTEQSLLYLKRISKWVIPLIVVCGVISLVSFFELFVRLSKQEYLPVLMNLLSFVLSSYSCMHLFFLSRRIRKTIIHNSEEFLEETFSTIRKLLFVICLFFVINLVMTVIIGFVR
ncbi:hypothetical protein BK054_03055 [Myroides sp. ZB35]|uniref:hypothetical protein n=1 Tax=Myroides TaxID=76831 RepID=UPI000280A3F7|nr:MULTISPECIES: hypothetical protein [Myroides]APA91218.1 hypothetical protein BK054_03055 [Myroides sp. ZB35]EKB02440.1 hypothetical protein HMPREF9711_03225 [Myroides odoratimimus CCUG 3837]SHM65680.1 hypothetical protein SAMN05444275_11937 [Myroides odoratimimus subsp. xuanwuensis]AJA67894.1 hypothetical protein MYRA21_0706 [Myroides sp. A21]MDM1327964.1 hypothetical protein [Myroides odoratimimus]